MTGATGTSTEAVVAAAELATVGHAALREALAAGVTELELMRAAEEAMSAMHGGPAEANVDLLSGERTELVDGPPAERELRDGDPVIFDLAPHRDGAWADSCATLCCGAPSGALRRRHDAVRRALEAGISSARPGVPTGAVDRVIRESLASAGLRCPHHTGHAVGAAPQQPPFLLPREDALLDEGMAIAIEPGAYGDGLGVRLEHLVLIEADGARPLTNHSLSLT